MVNEVTRYFCLRAGEEECAAGFVAWVPFLLRVPLFPAPAAAFEACACFSPGDEVVDFLRVAGLEDFSLELFSGAASRVAAPAATAP